jgi:hypothetical protein
MSLNMSVTVPSSPTAMLMLGRLASTLEATRAMEALTWLDALPWARILTASARSSHCALVPMRR